MHFVVLMLLCSASMSPDACTKETAVDVVSMSAKSELDCVGIGGQAQFATPAFDSSRKDTYVKTECVRMPVD